MLRSLYSGITGLRNHQLAMDVTSHNIANVNTTGYKSQRVTFKESMSQVLKGATRPPGNSGGTNPMQVGLGMGIGSIDTLTTQGAMQSTGQITDLAIQGRAYFAFSNGDGTFYSRNGALQVDGSGKLVSPNNGFTLQGLMADGRGVFPSDQVPGDITVPFGEKAPAQATSNVRYQSNLDKDSAGLGTIMHTGRFLADATDGDMLNSLFDENGNDLNITEGDILEINIKDATTTYDPIEITVGMTPGTAGEVANLSELAAAVQAALQDGVNGPGIAGAAVTVNANGQLNLALGGAQIASLNIGNKTRPTSDTYTKNLFNWSGSNITGAVNTSSGSARSIATVDDNLGQVYDAAGKALGLENGDEITISGTIGSTTLNTPATNFVYSYNAANPADPTNTTMQDLMDRIQLRLNLPNEVMGTDGKRRPTVEINASSGGDERAPEGAIMIRGQAQTAFALNGISISSNNSNNNSIAPSAFNSNMIGTEIQTARDTTVHSTSIEVFDESGQAHTMTTTFTHTGSPNKWLWEISMEGEESLLSGYRGTLEFGQDGSPSAWVFSDGTSSFRFNPMNGSNDVTINLDTGGPGMYDGITQFRSATTTAAKEQNGYPMGKLDEISITENGEIKGVYTNGVNKNIAKILVAEFNNPAGLLRQSNSMYMQSSNSGEGTLYEAGKGSTSTIKPGALEMSNVDLSTEFTSLITTQRGYQANARVITTSDKLLQELVQLVR